MKVWVENKPVNPELLQVPTMNFGQMQRWTDFVELHYSLQIEKTVFVSKTSAYFEDFRQSEMEEDDTEGYPELKAFKQANWPTLEAMVSEYTGVLAGLIRFNDYDILHLIIPYTKTRYNYYYSANSINEVIIEGEHIIIKGICFQSDYVEHTYNHPLPRNYALLK